MALIIKSLSNAQEECHRNIFNQYQQEVHLGRTSYISSCVIQYYKDIIVIRNRSYKYSDDFVFYFVWMIDEDD